MLRTTVGLSFLVLFGVLSACSSKATDNNNGSGGNGAVLGGSNSGGSGGTRSDTAGTTSANAGTAANTAGSNGLCPGDTLTCIDDKTATFCDANTGVEETLNCTDDFAKLGFVSSGCTTGTGITKDQCAIDSVTDEKCFAGAQGYAFCGGYTQSDSIDIYIDCYQDFMGMHAIVQCVSDYVSETMMADTDCDAAAQACLGSGAGGDGAGGAGPGAGGAGGAP